MASSANINEELALAITAAFTGITGLRSFAETHPPISPSDPPLVCVQPAGHEQFGNDRADRGVSIKRIVVTGDSAETSIRNARTVWSKLKDIQLSLTSFNVCLRAVDEPSFFRNENNVFFQNMRFRVYEVQTI